MHRPSWKNAYDALLRDEEDSTSTNPPKDESDIESGNERETEKVCDEVILRLFNSNTEEDDFSGLSAQEEDEDSDQRLFW